jgi:uncharacterized protein (TIGR03000 family)
MTHRVVRACLVAGLALAVASVPGRSQESTREAIRFHVQVPAGARVRVDDFETKSVGESRTYETPPLPTGKDHRYTLTVTSGGKTVTRQIAVRAGADNTFDLREGFKSTASASGEPKQENPDDRQVVSTRVTHRPRAASISFGKALNLPFPGLATLGARIDAARRAPDPVALAHAANELATAERVSRKQASLTSRELILESAELAKLRRQVAELRAVQQVSQQVLTEQDALATLKKQIAYSQELAKQDVRSVEKNEEPTWKPRTVLVNNFSTQYVSIFVNGSYKTIVPPGGAQTCVIEHRWNPTVLTANGNEDMDSWGPRYIWGRFDKYTWNINGDN